MTILCLADIRFPLERANGIQTMETCHALAARGHEVHLLVRPDTHTPARDPLAFYGLPPISCLRFERAPVSGPSSTRRAGYLAQALKCLLNPGRWDVALTRDLGLADIALRFPRWMRPPVVYESHGFAPVRARTLPRMVSGARPVGLLKLGRLRRRERRVWNAAEGYVTITRGFVRELEDLFGARPRVVVAPSGVRLNGAREYAPPPRTGPSTVAYAGHFYPWKGVDVLIEALALVPQARGLFIGGRSGDPDLDRLRSLVGALCLTERVSFTGPVPPPDVGSLLARADVLVLPTVAAPYARYTSPLKLFEYMAAGRPIVASDLPALREVLDHGGTAILVAPGDPAALAAGVRSVLDDPATADRMARAAFRKVDDYSWARRAERLERLFDGVIAPS